MVGELYIGVTQHTNKSHTSHAIYNEVNTIYFRDTATGKTALLYE